MKIQFCYSSKNHLTICQVFDKYQKLAIKKKCTHIIVNSSIKKLNEIRNINYYYINVQKDLFKIKKTFFEISKLKIIFLTGTNGKTSIAYGSHLLFSLNGIASCYLGTIGFFIKSFQTKSASFAPAVLSLL